MIFEYLFICIYNLYVYIDIHICTYIWIDMTIIMHVWSLLVNIYIYIWRYLLVSSKNRWSSFKNSCQGLAPAFAHFTPFFNTLPLGHTFPIPFPVSICIHLYPTSRRALQRCLLLSPDHEGRWQVWVRIPRCCPTSPRSPQCFVLAYATYHATLWIRRSLCGSFCHKSSIEFMGLLLGVVNDPGNHTSS